MSGPPALLNLATPTRQVCGRFQSPQVEGIIFFRPDSWLGFSPPLFWLLIQVMTYSIRIKDSNSLGRAFSYSLTCHFLPPLFNFDLFHYFNKQALFLRFVFSILHSFRPRLRLFKSFPNPILHRQAFRLQVVSSHGNSSMGPHQNQPGRLEIQQIGGFLDYPAH